MLAFPTRFRRRLPAHYGAAVGFLSLLRWYGATGWIGFDGRKVLVGFCNPPGKPAPGFRGPRSSVSTGSIQTNRGNNRPDRVETAWFGFDEVLMGSDRVWRFFLPRKMMMVTINGLKRVIIRNLLKLDGYQWFDRV